MEVCRGFYCIHPCVNYHFATHCTYHSRPFVREIHPITRPFILSENIAVMYQVLPTLDREGIAVTHKIEVVGDLDDGFVHMV